MVAQTVEKLEVFTRGARCDQGWPEDLASVVAEGGRSLRKEVRLGVV